MKNIILLSLTFILSNAAFSQVVGNPSDSYTGTDGKPKEGTEKIIYSDGMSIDQKFHEGKFLGQHHNFKNPWLANKTKGTAVYTIDTNGKPAEGTEIMTRNGQRTEQTYHDGLLEGVAKTYFPDGTLASETIYKNGVREVEKMYMIEHPSMVPLVIETTWSNNEKDPDRKTYRDGKLINEMIEKNGVYQMKDWDNDGNPIVKKYR